MADPGNAILYLLSNATGVTDLVVDRIYRKTLPQKPTYPAVTFQLVTAPPLPDHDPGPVKHLKPIFQVDCWGEDTDDASALYDAVFAALDNQKGLFAGVNVLGLNYSDDRDLHEDEPEALRRTLEFVMFTQS